MNALDIMLWGVLPYVVMATVVIGSVWRWRYDQFGWTTRSSQLYESRLLRLGSPLFHFGILVVAFGHVIGLIVPKSLTDAVGINQEIYHVQALALGGLAGICTVVGIAILIYRRRTTGPVFTATTRNDKGMYALLAVTILAGLTATVLGAFESGDGHNYRLSVSVWFRSLFVLRPDVEAMARADLGFHLHVLVAMLLFACWPFTRLVHAFSAPLKYLFRPYVVYRRRNTATSTPAARGPRRGWERVGRP